MAFEASASKKVLYSKYSILKIRHCSARARAIALPRRPSSGTVLSRKLFVVQFRTVKGSASRLFAAACSLRNVSGLKYIPAILVALRKHFLPAILQSLDCSNAERIEENIDVHHALSGFLPSRWLLCEPPQLPTGHR